MQIYSRANSLPFLTLGIALTGGVLAGPQPTPTCAPSTPEYPPIAELRYGFAYFGREEFDLEIVFGEYAGSCGLRPEPDPVVAECVGAELPCLIDGAVTWNSRLPGDRLRFQAAGPGIAVFEIIPHPDFRRNDPDEPGIFAAIRVFALASELNSAALRGDALVPAGRDLNGDGIVDAADLMFD